MSVLIYSAAFVAFALGVAHSYLGERYILMRLFRRGNLPKLVGGTKFTERILRFAWHLTSITFWGFAAVLCLLAQGSVAYQSLAMVVALTFLILGLVTLFASRGRHFAWPAFLFISGVCFYAGLA